jgi:hypothetical protein
MLLDGDMGVAVFMVDELAGAFFVFLDSFVYFITF